MKRSSLNTTDDSTAATPNEVVDALRLIGRIAAAEPPSEEVLDRIARLAARAESKIAEARDPESILVAEG